MANCLSRQASPVHGTKVGRSAPLISTLGSGLDSELSLALFDFAHLLELEPCCTIPPLLQPNDKYMPIVRQELQAYSL